MAISIRLEPQIERKLEQAATAEGLSKSEFVRRCLAKQLDATPVNRAKLAWELGKDVFGKFGSGRTDTSEQAEKILREAFAQKQQQRNAKRRNR
jgi:predicted transcriptional regulator